MLDLGQLGRYQGADFSLSTTNISMSQTTYTKNMLKQFLLDKCNLAKTPIAKGIKLSSDMVENRVDSTIINKWLENSFI
jgi:hypothetical protein